MSVKRYQPAAFSERVLHVSNEGEYVRYEDYAALEQQLAESHRALRAETTAHENTQMQLEKMAAENAGLKESRQRLAEFIHEELDAGYPLNMNIETPTTDAFLDEVRAQGADECVRKLVTSDDDDFSDAPNICAMVAYQLRKGVQHEQ